MRDRLGGDDGQFVLRHLPGRTRQDRSRDPARRRPARRVGRRTRSPRLGVRRPGPRDTPVAAQTAVGRVPGRTGRRMRAGPSPLITVPRPLKNGEQEVLESTQWRDVATGGQDPTGLGLDLPCTENPELFFAESPQDVEQAKAMCRGGRARLSCLAGALERGEPWGVWGGELLMRGAIVPCKLPRGRPRKDVVTIGASSRSLNRCRADIV